MSHIIIIIIIALQSLLGIGNLMVKQKCFIWKHDQHFNINLRMHRHVMRTSSGAMKRMHILHTTHFILNIYLSHVAYAYLWFGVLLRNYQSCLLLVYYWILDRKQLWLWTWRQDNRLHSTLSTALTWYIYE